MTEAGIEPLDFVRGDATGVRLPAHPEALRSAGEDFLTEAFRAFGALAADNRVAAITRCELCPGGSTGQKLFLSVRYARPAPHLQTDLFVKFSRDFGNRERDDRGKHEMKGEIRLAAMSRLRGFPIKIPKAYFADYQDATHTGLLITERIAYGVDGVESHKPKCLDHEFDAPIVHYRLIVRSLARIAAAHRAGRLQAPIDELFPFDPAAAAAANRIAYDAAELERKVARFADFALSRPQLFPRHIAEPGFFEDLGRGLRRFLAHQDDIHSFHQHDPDFIALCHWNANIDNAWFWRDAAGDLHCGLLDWGHAGQLNLAFSLWGCLSGAGLEIWDDHLEELIELFVEELAAGGGPRLAIAELRLHLDLYVVLMGLQYFLDSPPRIVAALPQLDRATGPRDTMFRGSETARNQLHISTNFLNLWARRQPARSLDAVLARSVAREHR